MPGLNILERLIDLRSRDQRPHRAAYALPTLFTAGNIFLGFVSVVESIQGAILFSDGTAGAEHHFGIAGKTIGLAILLDGLDGRIARVTNTTSDFGREMDSLADVISFGIAPAVLAFTWGVLFMDSGLGGTLHDHILRWGSLIAFLFLLCGSARLARFNIQKNPVPKNPGRPDRKYFVGLPIPAAAGMVAAIVYALDGEPLYYAPLTISWLVLLALLSFLMVSTWRYYSFKGISLVRPRTTLMVILLGGLIYLIWNYSQPVLVACAASYVASGIVIRVGGIVRRHLRPRHPKSRSTRLVSSVTT
jgi:CDP-diacylglycerol--serine O-phosphatidyltransferase